MKLLSLRNSIALALFSAALSVSAKPLVVCTEASPEGFDIVQYTTAVTADATAETFLDKLVGFKPAMELDGILKSVIDFHSGKTARETRGVAVES